MKVYIVLPEETEKMAAEVVDVKPAGLDLKMDNGAAIKGWRAPAYDEQGGEIPLDTIKRQFVASYIAALRARIEALEALMTEN